MDKQVQFFGASPQGVFCQALFGSAGAFEKVAGAPAFADWETGGDLRKFIRGITPAMRKENAYVLVNALGAGEYYGSNINADYFPWDALSHKGMDYGHKTFLNAHAFQHHKNKDPSRAFGKPILALLNTQMKRVELVVQLNREKAKAEGADGIIARIDAGEFPDVSMGCKVPYDVCSKCHHKSKTRNDYCEHMNPPAELRGIYGPNKILPDGLRICVINTLPRFFDISFVFIGADKTAKVMAKLASKGAMVCLGEICEIPRPSAEVAWLVGPGAAEAGASPSLAKTASAQCECGCPGDCSGLDKLASKLGEAKLSEILKEVPAGSSAMKRLPDIEKEEPDLPIKTLDGMAEEPLPDILGGLSHMGVVLKPHEFQRLVLKRMGEDELADELYGKNQVFRPSEQFNDLADVKLQVDELLKKLIPLLHDHLKSRTALGPFFEIRIRGQVMSPKKALPTPTPIAHPLLDKVSSAYNGYRRNFMMKLSQVSEAVQSDPQLRQAVLGETLVDMFTKKASTPNIVSSDSLAYLMGAHLEDRSLLHTTAVARAIAVSNRSLLTEDSA